VPWSLCGVKAAYEQPGMPVSALFVVILLVLVVPAVTWVWVTYTKAQCVPAV
jgi:hypothetical protein